MSLSLFKKHFQLPETDRGFSLTELLVAMSIFVALTTAMLVSYASTDSSAKLDRAENQVVDAIKLARNNAATVVEYSGKFPSYGIAVEDGGSSMILYADCEVDDNSDGIIDDNDDFSYTPDSNVCGGNNGGFVEEIGLEAGTSISSLTLFSDATTTSERVYVQYVRPLPTIYISDPDGGVLPYGRLEIELSEQRSDLTRTVVVFTSGLIEVD